MKKIDWKNIKSKITYSDPKNRNKLNPCSNMSKEEREEQIIEVCAKICERISMNKNVL